MEQSNRLLLSKEERPPVSGQLNEVENITQLEAYASWFSEDQSITTTEGKPFKTGYGFIRYGLPQVVLAEVKGWFAGDENPADRATVAEGEHRLSVYHRDHTGQVINPAFEHAYKHRLSTVALTVGIREVCGCGIPDDGCLVHPVEQTGGGLRNMGSNNTNGDHAAIHTGRMVMVGDIATLYGNRLNAGTQKGKVGIVGLIGGVPYIVGWRTASKRGGMGAKGQRDPSLIQYRHATSCDACGRRTCWGNCTPDSHLRFFIGMTQKGRTLLALDPRGPDSIADVRAALESQAGVGAVIISDQPFESGWTPVYPFESGCV
jgi:hypothetical protein